MARPPQDWLHAVDWSDRSWNKQADYIANRVMDTKQSYMHIYPEVLRKVNNGGVLIFSDGGLWNVRSQGRLRAAAWVVYLVASGTYTLLAFEGKLLTAVSSAFEAEAIALDLAMEFLGTSL